MAVTIKAGESNGAMVRGSARNSVVGRAESLRSTSGARDAGQGGIERRTIRLGPERDGGPERTAASRGAQDGCRGRGRKLVSASAGMSECQFASRGIS